MFEIGRDVFKQGFYGGQVDRTAVSRLRVVYLVFLLAFSIFALRTLQLGIQGTDTIRKGVVASNWNISRADIVDRNGEILAKNLVTGHIQLVKKYMEDKDKELIAQTIHEVLPYQYSLSDAMKLVDSPRRYIELKRNASETQIKKIRDAALPGLEVRSEQLRKYPKRNMFSHVVGFLNKDGHAVQGAEAVFDDYLSENKDPLYLSVDSRVQSAFYEQLSLAMQKYQTKTAMGMLMDSRTGEIIAMVSLPDFDPENIGNYPVANRTLQTMRNPYELGSIFKIFNTALAMENGIDKEYLVNKPFIIEDKFGRPAAKITDVRSFKPPRPYLNVEEIMMMSCNVGSAQIALDLPDGAQKEFVERLHMDKALDLEMGRTERTILPQKWGPVEKATVAYGHGISVTPMHLLLAVNAVTNGGFYVKPTLQKRGVGVVRAEKVLEEEISERLRAIMFRVAEETTAKQARVAGIKIGGKTGTAEKYGPNGKIDRKRNVTAFVGIFPVDAPQYTIMVVLDEPKGYPRTASYNAVPVTGKILETIVPLLFE